MFAPSEPSIKLSKMIFFNRFLCGLLGLNLLIYTIQLNYHENATTNILIIACWLVISVYILINEIINQIIKKPMMATPEVRFVLTRVNAVFTAILIIKISYFTGNTALMFLYMIPVLQSLFSSSLKFAAVLLGIGFFSLFTADFSGLFASKILIANKHVYTPLSFTYCAIMGLLSYLGYIFSDYSKHNNMKANTLLNLATTDALTGLLNRREFNRRLSEEISRAKRHKSELTLALFDIDYFKRVNDNYGHNIGDELLKELGEIISLNTRNIDIAARYGGEEFALILPETTIVEANELLERLRIMIEKTVFCMPHTRIPSTISIGIAQLDSLDYSSEDLCVRADKALYQAKRNGRNRVECASFSLPKLDLSKILTYNSN